MTDEISQRESEVWRLVAEGLANSEIAARLSISPRTVEAHLRAIYGKVNARNRTHLALMTPPPGANSQMPSTVDTVDTRDRRLELYEALVEHLIDRQPGLFEERVEITLRIGDSSENDIVVERRWTSPTPYLHYRIVRPLVLSGNEDHPDGRAFLCRVVNSDRDVRTYPLLDSYGALRLLVAFQPGLAQPEEWELTYRLPGLWDPLRRDGEDSLSWLTGRWPGRYDSRGSVRELGFKFEAPASMKQLHLSERGGAGRFEKEQRQDGGTTVTWSTVAPLQNLYIFALNLQNF